MKKIIVILFIISSSSITAQDNFMDNTKLGINLHRGWSLPEYEFLSFITEDYITSVDLTLSKETTGKNKWERLYNYPTYGISLFYSTLGNDDLIGRELALTYFFKLDAMKRERFSIYNRTGIGLGYVNKKFDLTENYYNVAVGSHLNIHFNFRWGANYDLTENLELNGGLSFDHFSNANTSEPNLGINYLTCFGGLNCRLGEKTEKIFKERPPHERKNEFAIFASIGGKHARSLSSKYFLTSSLSLEIDRSVWRGVHLGIGADLFYDSSQETQLQETGRTYESHFDFQTGIHFSQTLRYNRFSISLQEGFYIGLKENIERKTMYNRGIIRYQINNRLWVRLSMKSHFVILDYPEFGLGVKL